MKKIIILFLVLCGAGLGTSCDDFLTEHPSTQFSPEDVYSSPNGVQALSLIHISEPTRPY